MDFFSIKGVQPSRGSDYPLTPFRDLVTTLVTTMIWYRPSKFCRLRTKFCTKLHGASVRLYLGAYPTTIDVAFITLNKDGGESTS